MTPRTYASPEAFKQALEQRLRTFVTSGAGLARKRQLLVFERFLARVVAEDVLAFAGIAPPTLRLYPIETHLAEKLHAYTMPRTRPNSRVKDLPDIALLATAQPIDAKRLRAALEQTFTFRATHALPATVPAPNAAWRTPYEAMARDDQLMWRTLDEVTQAAQAFLDPVLAGALDATWGPETWSWRAH